MPISGHRLRRRPAPAREPPGHQLDRHAGRQAGVVPGHGRGRRLGGFDAAQPLDLAKHGVQALALDVLHGVVVHAVVLADAEDRHDVGVVEHGRGAGLALEPLELARVAQAVLRQDLERHVPAQALLHRLVDDAHAAAGDLPQDAVVAQPLGAIGAELPAAAETPRSAWSAPLPNCFDRDQGREQLADLVGELGILVGVLARAPAARPGGAARRTRRPAG